MSSVRSNNISLKYQRFTTFDFKDIWIIKSEFVANNQLLWPQDELQCTGNVISPRTNQSEQHSVSSI